MRLSGPSSCTTRRRSLRSTSTGRATSASFRRIFLPLGKSQLPFVRGLTPNRALPGGWGAEDGNGTVARLPNSLVGGFRCRLRHQMRDPNYLVQVPRGERGRIPLSVHRWLARACYVRAEGWVGDTCFVLVSSTAPAPQERCVFVAPEGVSPGFVLTGRDGIRQFPVGDGRSFRFTRVRDAETAGLCAGVYWAMCRARKAAV